MTLKHFIPKFIRNAWRKKTMELLMVSPLARKIDVLELELFEQKKHSENITTLLVQTIANLENVGKALQQVDIRLSESIREISELYQQQEKENKLLLKKTHDNHQQICNLNLSIQLLQTLIFQQLKAIYPRNESTEKTIYQFKKEFSVPDQLNVQIAKNDLMFLYSLLHIGNYDKAYHSYLSAGLNAYRLIDKLVANRKGGWDEVHSFLDFASGYGRLTRFMILKLLPEQVWVSDVKKQAVAWQKKQFGVNGFSSSFIPENIQPDQSFDLIYVGSLFSHLPEHLFHRWLKKLWEMLSEKGMLIFSLHDMSLWKGEVPPPFIFHAESEDTRFRSIDDHIEDGGAYGVSYASEAFVAESIQKLEGSPAYHRYPKALGQLQDVYVITRNTMLPEIKLDFSSYP